MDLTVSAINSFFSKLYLQFVFCWTMVLFAIKRPFLLHQRSDKRPSTIITNLLGNLEEDERMLIMPHESVEETFLKRIAEKDYDTAMKLAKKFDLDTDIIYKNRWQDNDKTIDLIDDCLSKVSKPIWSLNECARCVPRNFAVLKHLLQFGIRISSSEYLTPFLQESQNLDDTSEIQLSEEAQQMAQLHRTLSHYLLRLELYEKILIKKYNDDYKSYYNSVFYSNYRNRSLFEWAIKFANEGDHVSVEILFKREHEALRENLLVIIANLPETHSPLIYKCLFESVFDTFASNLNVSPTECSSITSLLSGFEQEFFSKNGKYSKYKIGVDSRESMLTEWFDERAREMLDCTLMVDNALELLRVGIEHGLSLQELFTQMDLYSVLLYDTPTVSPISFQLFEQKSPIEKLIVIFDKFPNIVDVIESVFNKFIDKLTRYQPQSRTEKSKELLKSFLVILAKSNFEQCLKIFELHAMAGKTLKEIQQLQLINDPCDLIELALACLSAYQKPEDLYIAFRILECLPDRNQCDILIKDDPVRKLHFNRINDQADKFEYYLGMIEVFHEHNTNLTLNHLKNVAEQNCKEGSEAFFQRLINNFCKKSYDNIEKEHLLLEWKNFLWNLNDLRKTCFPFLLQEEMLQVTVRCLLFSAKQSFIEIAFNYINFNTSESSKKLNLTKGSELLKQAAADYIKFADPFHDENIQFAKLCLERFRETHLVDELVIRELDFIQALTILYEELDFQLLPIKVKHLNGNDLMEAILTSSSSTYKHVSSVVRVSTLLRIFEGLPAEEGEAQVLSMIGQVATRYQDYQAVLDICSDVMQRNLKHAWNLCLEGSTLPGIEALVSREDRLRMISFALAHCPEHEIATHYTLLNMIKHLKVNQANHLTDQPVFIQFRPDLCYT